MEDHPIAIKYIKLPHFSKDLSIPRYRTQNASGVDIQACIGFGKQLCIERTRRVLIPTGLSLEVPIGYEIQVRPRSGLSLNTGLIIVNSPGTIDADYRGEIKIIMGNFGMKDETISHGDRIAQLVLSPVCRLSFSEISQKEASKTQRDRGGFGHTGR